MIHYDRWWNPAVEDQATDRAYRIGQDRNVQVYKLVVQATLEERIDALLEKKRALADSVVGGGEGWVTELGNDALRSLTVRFTSNVFDGDEVVAGGVVTAIDEIDGERRATCDVWLDRGDGTRAIEGVAVVALDAAASDTTAEPD